MNDNFNFERFLQDNMKELFIVSLFLLGILSAVISYRWSNSLTQFGINIGYLFAILMFITAFFSLFELRDKKSILPKNKNSGNRERPITMEECKTEPKMKKSNKGVNIKTKKR